MSRMTGGGMRLSELAHALDAQLSGGDTRVGGVAIDSRLVRRGDLFVALPGARHDGSAFVPEALARGAAAVCAAAAVAGVPTLIVADPRPALARIAAEMNGWPSREMTLVGITGSLGKTSTALLLEEMLAAAGGPVGVIGSLGIRYGGGNVETGMTTPEAPAIHGALRAMRDAGVRTAIMEVTTHAILFHRVTGLEYALGIITNLVPDEHLELHPTPEHYVRTKARFLDMLLPGAPLVLNADDVTVRSITRGLPRPCIGVSFAGSEEAEARVEEFAMDGSGSRFTLRVARALPRLDGGEVAPMALPVRMRLLGPQLAANAALAAVAALIAGIPADAVAAALARSAPMHRRMEIIHADGPVILDDTVGNPASIDAVFATTRAMPHERLHVVYCIRGARGHAINQHNALALAARAAHDDTDLIITASEDAADERNRVTDEERDTVLGILRDADVPFQFHPALATAIRQALDAAGERDLVLLLGAQGMDRGAEIARELLEVEAAG
ncbi:MAG TPA: Mur ligase family protein [Gemmatimonadaceae bacterium]|nr:Mur ligase family protein [Gemmatimonadaceae bacterium]